jgi:hypothetical protein
LDKPPGSEPAQDHDRFFKELLTTFFVEFVDLFFPKIAEALDRSSVEFLSEEHYANLLDGDAYRVDIIAKARFRERDAYFLIHVEHQSSAPAQFPRRFFRYFSLIFEKHGLPVYPIVVYSHDTPRKKQPDTFQVDFPDGDVLRFRYRVVQLNRLSWRKFVNTANPVASALLAKMNVAPRDRARVKLECLRLLVTLQLDRARMKLIGSFVDAYLRLEAREERRFERLLRAADLKPEQREEIVEYVTSWEQRGIEKGLEMGRSEGLTEGLTAGRIEGRLEELRLILIDILTTRFGPIDPSLLARIQNTASLEALRALSHRALTTPRIDDLEF